MIMFLDLTIEVNSFLGIERTPSPKGKYKQADPPSDLLKLVMGINIKLPPPVQPQVVG